MRAGSGSGASGTVWASDMDGDSSKSRNRVQSRLPRAPPPPGRPARRRRMRALAGPGHGGAAANTPGRAVGASGSRIRKAGRSRVPRDSPALHRPTARGFAARSWRFRRNPVWTIVHKSQWPSLSTNGKAKSGICKNQLRAESNVFGHSVSDGAARSDRCKPVVTRRNAAPGPACEVASSHPASLRRLRAPPSPAPAAPRRTSRKRGSGLQSATHIRMLTANRRAVPGGAHSHAHEPGRRT